MTLDYISILGYAAGLLVVISLLPQVIQSWKTKSTKDISLWRYIIYVAGLVLWIVYAIIIQNGPVAVMNGVGLALALSILYLKLKYG
ncbi:PQ loop repeat protein [uncultured archaeon]|nr:PQ loop repeat protein [uncultured archaeon]